MLDPDQVVPVPWRNGAGSTRELALGLGADGGADWRISVATLDGEAPFSAFPGMDRVFVALGALRLTIDGDVVLLADGDQARFAGESTVAVSVEVPTRALNVMTRRGRCGAEVRLRPGALPASGPADHTVLLAERAADIRLLPSSQELT